MARRPSGSAAARSLEPHSPMPPSTQRTGVAGLLSGRWLGAQDALVVRVDTVDFALGSRGAFHTETRRRSHLQPDLRDLDSTAVAYAICPGSELVECAVDLPDRGGDRPCRRSRRQPLHRLRRAVADPLSERHCRGLGRRGRKTAQLGIELGPTGRQEFPCLLGSHASERRWDKCRSSPVRRQELGGFRLVGQGVVWGFSPMRRFAPRTLGV